jgi:hypothetical protein
MQVLAALKPCGCIQAPALLEKSHASIPKESHHEMPPLRSDIPEENARVRRASRDANASMEAGNQTAPNGKDALRASLSKTDPFGGNSITRPAGHRYGSWPSAKPLSAPTKSAAPEHHGSPLGSFFSPNYNHGI